MDIKHEGVYLKALLIAMPGVIEHHACQRTMFNRPIASLSRRESMVLQKLTDKRWPDVELINGHAINMRIGFLGVKGLGVLVLTWATVVLLGGFVSVLHKKDFWSLTAIALVELAGTFDIIMADRVRGYMLSPFRAASAKFARIVAHRGSPLPKVRAFLCLGLELLVNSVKKCFEAVLLVFGLYISTGTSLWRLIVHDYGNADGGANLKPALVVLYLLAVVQGAMFVYMNCYAFLVTKWLVRLVGKKYNLHQTNQLVSKYLDVTVAGCKLDKSFSEGKNLVTYAVDLLMKSKSPESHINVIRDIREMLEASLGTNREVMVKQLLTDSVSFSHIVRKLQRIIHPGAGFSRKTREHAAGILIFFVADVHLEQFPGAIQSISSLLDSSDPWLPERYQLDCALGLAEESDQGDWLLEIQQRYNIYKNYELGQQEVQEPFSELLSVHKKMFLQGLSIFGKLADDEDNSRIMSNTEGLMSRITAPLMSSRLHQDHHEEWTSIAEETLPLMCRFMANPGETGAKLRRQISSNGEATLTALQGILECDTCISKQVLLDIATEILLDLAVDTSCIMASTRSSGTYILALLRIFLVAYYPNELKLFQKMYSSVYWMKKRSYIRNLAGEKLARMCSQSERSAGVILQAVDESFSALRELSNTLVGAKNNTYRMRAAEILENLCSNYANDDEYLKSLKKALLDAMPKVLTEILGCGSTRAATQAETEVNQPRYSAVDADLEEGPALPDNEQRNIHSSHKQMGEEHGNSNLHEALLSLCAMVCQKLITTDPDLSRRFDEIASNICSEQGKPVMAFTLLVEEACRDVRICIG